MTKNEEGRTLGTVFVQLREAQYEQSPRDYVQQRKKALEKKFPDLNANILESSSGSGHVFTARYSYVYTWEGDPIKAIVSVSKRRQWAIELSYLALEDHFNKQEFDQIIHSFHRLP
ncbi:MAG: hypothetical protein AMJ65_16520 [Phycisphaerae bacterium SG8_4]|nr:MAG: hypothetical protein AMJ65_16520 [Phycisphaerae bacterium SG8_4]